MSIEPDLAIRYALWRLCNLARGRDVLSESAARVRLAVVPPDYELPLTVVEPVITTAAGEELERVFLDESSEYLSGGALERFRRRVARARGTSSKGVRFRLVSHARLFRVPDDGALRDFADTETRRNVLARISFLAELGREDVLWDLGRHTRAQLSAECLFQLATLREDGDAGDLYVDLYDSLRDKIEGEPGLQPRRFLFFEHLSSDRDVEKTLQVADAEDVEWWRSHVLATPRVDPTDVPQPGEKMLGALRRGLFFGESRVTLEEIYVRQSARFWWLDRDDEGASQAFIERASALLFWWLAQRDGWLTSHPLLVQGSFGSGKSSLLTMFAKAVLLQEVPVIPLLIPLRDLTGVTTSQPLHQVLVEHVRRLWELDLDAPLPRGWRYCLFCDGFDELNLYYLNVDTQTWVSDCFRSLCLLARRPDVDVVISTRPVLFMDVTRRDFEGAECPFLELHLFSRVEIDQWCTSYQRAAGLRDFFTSDDLEVRDLLEVARTPLILYMMARVHEFERGAFQEVRSYTRAEIYRRFIDWTESGGYRRDKTKHVVPRNYRDILREIAYFFYRRGDGFVEEESLLAHLRSVHGDAPDRVPTDRNLLVAHMFQPVEHSRDEPGHLVEFTHQSFRDYLFAEWIWKRLEPARQGAGLDPKTWNELGIKVSPPPQEIVYLAEMISTSPWDEALALYKALDDTDNVHQYWGKWLKYAWEELVTDPRPENVDALRGRVTVTASRAAGLATLGFILRTRCFARLRQLAAAPPERELPSPLSTKELGNLLHLLKTFPDQGVGSDNRRVLLANLSGIVLSGVALDGHQLENVDFSGARLRGINFSASRWLEVDVRGADLEGASLRQGLLTFKATDGASFRKANFGDSILSHHKDGALVRADFTEADFLRTRLLDLTFEECRLVGNKWTGAARLHSTAGRPSRLLRCELDEAAEAFFVEQGFELEDCRLAVEDLREVEDPSV